MPEVDEFEILRKRARERGIQRQQETDQTIKRQFASQGMLGSGAHIKQAQLGAQESERITGEQLGELDIAQARENQRRREVSEGRDFATRERVGSQEFAGQQAGLQRGFLSAERLGGQEFAGQQAGLQRGFATSERLGGQQFAGEQAGLQRGFLTSERLGGQQFAQGERLGSQQFATGERREGQQFAQGERAESQAFASGEAALARAQQADQFQKQIDFEKTKLATANQNERAQIKASIAANSFNAIIAGRGLGIDPERVNNFINSFGITVDDNGQLIVSSPNDGTDLAPRPVRYDYLGNVIG